MSLGVWASQLIDRFQRRPAPGAADRHPASLPISRRGALGAALSGLAGLVLATRSSPADAATLALDAYCPGPAGAAYDDRARFAQTFRARNTGKLKRVVIKIQVSTADVTVQLRTVADTGAPSDTVLAEVTRFSLDTDFNFVKRAFVFPDPPKVVAGRSYAIVVSRGPSGTLGPFTADQRTRCGGRAWVDPGGTGTFERFLKKDLVYYTYVVS